jgi:acetylornithine/succinyldiaminopimelate/putrescine aminotransferase
VDEQGVEYIDLSSTFGTTWIGHVNPTVKRCVAEQLDRIWLAGAFETEVHDEARAAVDGFFPDTHGMAGLYSTGMEASEFAIRLAQVETGRNGLIGFLGGMHGKSQVTAHMGWKNPYWQELPRVHRLPFVPAATEREILKRVDCVLEAESIAAVFIEPIQGSAGGHQASDAFYEDLYECCRARGTLLIFDELLTGFWRTGLPFFFSNFAFVPDVVLVGKAMSNGFPASAVVVDRKIAVDRRMLPGSTYGGNPLAASAVVATLEQLRALNMQEMVAEIESTITQMLQPLEELGVQLRGRGALWILEVPPHVHTDILVRRIYAGGVLVSSAGSYVRILPAATIEQDCLTQALTVLSEEVARACRPHDT